MSQTVSFVVRDDLAEWLESRADEEMKTVSSVVQDIVAAEYRRQTTAGTANESVNESETSGDALDRHPDVWYRPDSDKHNFAVNHPSEDKTRYYKTRDGAAKRIRTLYE